MRPFLAWLGWAAAAIVGVIFLTAAFLKGADLALFATQITDYGLSPSAWSAPSAVLLVILEGVLGVGLLLWFAPRVAIPATAALLLIFIAATAIGWARGDVTECGCFGRLAARGPGEVIVEDLVFLALLGIAWRLGPKSPPLPRARRCVAVGLILVALAWPWIGPHAPVDRWVTGIGPGADLSGLSAEDLRLPLEQGAVLVALVGPDCAACDASLPALEQIGQSEPGLRVAAIFAGDRAARRAWQLEHVPGFPVGHASQKALRQYYRRLPVVFRLQDGEVIQVWWGRAPDPGDPRLR